MKAKVRQLGNSLAIILPKDVLDLFGLKENDEVEINAKSKQIELVLKKKA
jgi:AbrB family looped-hinge helix DNA binding protein